MKLYKRLLLNGSLKLPLPDSQFDRFISNYVFDLLPPNEIEVVVKEAHRVLVPEGRLCLISLTHGFTLLSRTVVWLWSRLFAFRPALVGGCRSLRLLDFISEKAWQVLHHNSVVAFGIPSEVVVACKLPAPGTRSTTAPEWRSVFLKGLKQEGKMRLNLKALALAGGIVWALALFLTGVINLIWPGYGEAFLKMMASVYPGYHAAHSIGDLIVGTLYAVIDGAIGGLLFGWLYNIFVGKKSVSE